jgi:D-glycero-alpha-D-manno-heptose-7-phosphate kinase
VIIVRAPLRITLGGGGTDVASFYREHGGMCLAAAIDKYVYITIHETFVDELIVKYSKLERVARAADIQHPIIRAVLQNEGFAVNQLEISSMADIPSGTGLGSSSSFTVALIKAIRQHFLSNDWITSQQLAERACHIEIGELHEPIGKQDQYMAAYGGLRCLIFEKNGQVLIDRVHLSNATRHDLEDYLLLFFTGYARSTATVLAHPLAGVDVNANLHAVMSSAEHTRDALENGDLERFAHELDVQWLLKVGRLKHAVNQDIVRWYERGVESGALGGKLVGAGGGGFLMFFASDARRLRTVMAEEGLPEVRFRFDTEGARAVLQ